MQMIPVDLLRQLVAFVKTRYPEEYKQNIITIPSRYKQFKRLGLFGKVYGSACWRNGECSNILSRWTRSTRRNRNVGTMYPGSVQFYMQVDFIFNDGETKHCKPHKLVKCFWYQSQTYAQRLVDSRWKTTLCSDKYDVIMPIYNIAADFIPAPTGKNTFQILTLPNQLTLWTPDEYVFNNEA